MKQFDEKVGDEYQKGLCAVSEYSENLKDIEERMRHNRVDIFANFGSDQDHSQSIIADRRFDEHILVNAANYELRPIAEDRMEIPGERARAGPRIGDRIMPQLGGHRDILNQMLNLHNI